MKFSCNQNYLVKALNIVSKAVTSRTTIPILKGILLKVNEEGILTMSASDLDISIEKSFKVDNYEPGEVVVQAKLFGDIIRKLPNGEIYIIEENENILIRCNNSEFNIIGSSSDEFPIINPKENNISKLIFNKELLKEMIRKTSFAASIDESRGVITGILVESDVNKITMVALDGFRMAVTNEDIINGNKESVIIPAKIFNEIGKIISEEESENENVELLLNEKKAVFILENTKVVLKLLEGEFVKYNDILPKESSVKVVLNRSDFMESIERASLMAKIGKNNLIKLEIKDNEIEITSKSEEGNVKEKVLISKEGNDLTIGFNSKYLIDAIKAVDDEEIKLLFNTPVSPCLIKPLEGENYIYLVLPVRITNN